MVTRKSTNKVKYSPDWCDAVIELGRQGLVLSSYATSLGLSVNQLQAFMQDKPDFAQAVEVAMSFALSYHEQQLALANQTKGSQPQLTLAFLKSNWPEKYNADTKAARADKSTAMGPEEHNKFMGDLFTLFLDLAKGELEENKTLADHIENLEDLTRRFNKGLPA